MAEPLHEHMRVLLVFRMLRWLSSCLLAPDPSILTAVQVLGDEEQQISNLACKFALAEDALAWNDDGIA